MWVGADCAAGMPALPQTPHQLEVPSCENTLAVCWLLVANKVSLCGRAVSCPTESTGQHGWF